jgi:hypothetical protein
MGTCRIPDIVAVSTNQSFHEQMKFVDTMAAGRHYHVRYPRNIVGKNPRASGDFLKEVEILEVAKLVAELEVLQSKL